jgi:hypothetical protein
MRRTCLTVALLLFLFGCRDAPNVKVGGEPDEETIRKNEERLLKARQSEGRDPVQPAPRDPNLPPP